VKVDELERKVSGAQFCTARSILSGEQQLPNLKAVVLKKPLRQRRQQLKKNKKSAGDTVELSIIFSRPLKATRWGGTAGKNVA